MSTSATAALLRQLRQWAAGRGDAPHSDRELLRRFATNHEEAAFATLVRRHGPMVLSVCRRLLPHAADAEDAFQATFLVLLRRAATHSWHESIGGWLHGVATRISLHQCAAVARRAAVIPRAEESLAADPLEQVTARELLAAFDEELARLSQRYRAPLVLCCLQGKTQEETARLLDCSLSTIRRRLEHGRRLLHTRLTRRGLELSTALGAALLSQEAAAAVPPLLRVSVVQLMHGSVSGRVAALAEGVLQTAVLTPMRAAVLLLGILAAGAGLAAPHFLAQQSPHTETAANAPPDKPTAEKVERTDLYGDPLPPGALIRMGTIRFRHPNAIGNVAYSSDGKLLAAAGEGGIIRLYDPATGRKVRQFRAQAHQYPSIAFAPDGETLVSFGTNLIQVWDINSGRELRRFSVEATDADSHFSTIPLAFSPDGRLLASTAPDHSVRVWEAKSGKELAKLPGHQGRVCCLAFSPDGKSLLSASDRSGDQAGSVLAWKVVTGEELRKISLHRPGAAGTVVQPTPLCFSPDGKTLALASWQWLKRKHAKGMTAMQAHAVALLELETGKEVRKMGPMLGRLKAASFSPDGKIITAMNDEHQTSPATSQDESSRIKGWETSTGKQLFDFPSPTTSSDFWGGGGTLLAFASDGKTLAAASGSSLHIWDLAHGRENLQKPETHDSKIYRVAFSPEGRILASASSDHIIALWDAITGKQRLRLRGHEGEVTALVFSPDGKLLASASHNNEQSVRLWDVAAGKELRRYDMPHLPIGDGSAWAIVTWTAFTANGKTLTACSSEGRVRLWDVGTGKELFSQRVRGLPALPKGHKAAFSFTHDPVFTPDGRLIAFSIAKTIYIADVAAGQSLFQLDQDDLRKVLALSPDGKTLLCRAGKSIRFLEAAGGKDLHKIDMSEEAFSAAFSPDGRTVAVSTGDTKATIHFFDVPTGKEILRLQGHGARVDSLVFSPDGTKLASGQWDSTALIWDVSAARRKLPSNDLTTRDLERLWTELRDQDAAKAHTALWALVAAPEKAVPFLKERLHPVPPVSAERLQRLVSDLDAEDFARREEATRELTKLGSDAEAALRKALGGKPSLEMRRRIEGLLNDLACQTEMTRDALRQLRAIQVLEQIGSPQARQILASLAQGAPAAPATRDAAAALQRLNRRVSGP